MEDAGRGPAREGAVDISRAAPSFARWHDLLQLLHAAFAYQHARIDPPSSLLKLDAQSLAAKAREEALFVATDHDELVGCVFARPKAGSLYIGKFAVLPGRQGRKIGARLLDAVERFALHAGFASIELDTRIELTENHATFGRLGFVKVAEGAHAGYDRITFITMRKRLAGSPS